MPDPDVLLVRNSLKITMQDGCEAMVTANGGNMRGWSLLLPKGTVFVCPHGQIFQSADVLNAAFRETPKEADDATRR